MLQVKLDPAVLAMMEKRVAEGIAAERAKLMAQYGALPDGAPGGGMSAEERLELEALRKRVAGLGRQAAQPVRPCHMCVLLLSCNCLMSCARMALTCRRLVSSHCCHHSCKCHLYGHGAVA